MKDKIQKLLETRLAGFTRDPMDQELQAALAEVVVEEMKHIDGLADAFIEQGVAQAEALALGILMHCAMQSVQWSMLANVNRTMHGTNLDALYGVLTNQLAKQVHVPNLGGRAN